MKTLVKGLLKLTPYKVVQQGALNRFDAVNDALLGLARRGYRPQRIVDGGANVGTFTKEALKLFPGAVIHAVEPQPGCQSSLESLENSSGNRVIRHAVALCAPEDGGTTLGLGTDDAATSTGAHVTTEPASGSGQRLTVPCETIDRMLEAYRKENDHMLLKLDLQGYELHALRGALETLKTTDVVLTEVSFFAQAYEPPIAQLVSFLWSHGFELYDVAALYARPRDGRPRQGDFLFVKQGSGLSADARWD